VSLENLDNAGDATGQIEALMHFDNADANDAPLYGIRIDDTQPWGASALLLPIQNDATTPTLAFGDGDSGIYESVDDNLRFVTGGASPWTMTSTTMGGAVTDRPIFRDVAPTAIVPNIVPDRGDNNTGIGKNADDQLSLIAGGDEFLRGNVGATGVT
jgi:hypothetical protein